MAAQGQGQAKEERMKVKILSREKIVTYPKIRQPKETIAVTFVAPGLPPATVFIPADEYSKEREIEEIRKKIEELKRMQPEEVEI